MRDLILAAVILYTCAGLGLPVARLLPACPGRLLAAPAFGLAMIGVGTTLGYRYGVAPWIVVGLGAVAATITLAAHCLATRKLPQRATVAGAAVAVAVLMLALAPRYTGGAQFAAFQGNHYDQINYLSFAATVRNFSYRELVSFTAADKKKADFYALVSENPDDRWTVSIIYAGFVDLIGLDTTDSSYAYMAALQILFFFSVVFLLAQLSTGLNWRVWLCGAAAALGFPIQYVIDINAWSEMAALPICLVALACVLLRIGQDASEGGATSAVGAPRVRLDVAAGALLGALLYLYPEIVPIYSIGFSAAALWAALGETSSGRLRLLRSAVIVVATALVMCLPYVNGTLRFLLAQLGSATRARPDWWLYFQGYLIDAYQHGGALPLAISNSVLAAFGLYFVLPAAGASFSTAWGLLDGAFLLATLGAAAACWIRTHRAAPRSHAVLCLISAIAMSATVAAIALSGRYWVAGKALSMIQPMLFICVSAPLWLGARPSGARPLGVRRWLLQVPSLALAALYLGFGVARPIAAAAPDGIHYPRPYPSIQEAALKQNYRWDFARYSQAIRQCKAVVLDVDNIALERYAQVFLTGFKTPWYSTHAIDPNWGSGPELGLQEPLSNPDCVLTSKPSVSYGSAKVLSLRSE